MNKQFLIITLVIYTLLQIVAATLFAWSMDVRLTNVERGLQSVVQFLQTKQAQEK